jgi:outer membrane protein assembly factor BamD (BamD/ComL family)
MARLFGILTAALMAFGSGPSHAQSQEGSNLVEPLKPPAKSKLRKRRRDRKVTTPPPAAVKQEAPPASPTSQPPAARGTETAPADAAKAAADKKPDKPAPTMTFDAIDVSGKSADRQRLEVAIQQFKSQEYEQAALTAYDLTQDPKFVDLSLEAQYVMAKSLYRMGMYHSALSQFSKILAKGPGTKFFKTSLEWLFFISHKTVNESVILDEIAKYSNHEFPEKFRNEYRYLLARYHFVRGRALDAADQKAEADKSFDELKKITALVPRGDPFYVRARYLESLALFRENKMNAAMETMKDVVRLTRPDPQKSANRARMDDEVRQLAFMQLARIHYGARQNRNAIYYYSKVDRGSEPWLDSLFEASWANYRIGQYEQALGNLITLSSPFFTEEYYPEAMILKAVIYYENCRYRETTSILDDFDRTYDPVRRQLEVYVEKNMDAAEYYNVLAEVQKRNKEGIERSSTDVILERILKLALTDKDLKQTNDSILELEAELEVFGKKADSFKYSGLSKVLIDQLKKERETLIQKAGVMARSKLETELGELRKLLGNGERIRFETTTKEKEFLEQQLAAGGPTEIVKKYKYSVAVPDEQLYWPYEGEYWRDELGTYQYTLTKGCIDRDTGNRTPAADAQ